MNEYSTEKFIEQYEHIKKLELLSDSELNQLKRKRAHFEVGIKSAKDVKSFIEYIKYEIVLMKKFMQIDYSNENDGRALDRAMCVHIRDIYKQAVRRFQDNRKMWSYYIEFAKMKFPNSVTSIFQQMLGFHHADSDYIEAANHEMDKQNYYVAINFLIQGMSNEKKNSKLVALHIECSLKQAEASGDEKFKERSLAQVTKYFDKYIKSTKDVQIYIDLLKKIQNLTCSITFQNQILQYLLIVFCSRPEVWNLLADRHLNGLFFQENSETENSTDMSFNNRLRHALTIYDRSLEMVDDKFRTQMFDFYLNKLMELDMLKTNLDDYGYQCIRSAFIKTLDAGYKKDCLSEDFYTQYLKLCIMDSKKSREDIEEVIVKGSHLYPHSMEFYEVAIKFYFKIQKYENISLLFKQSIKNNEKDAIHLYEFLCQIYLQNPEDKERLIKAMMEAIASNDKNLSANFQPCILQYYAFSENIEKAREVYTQMLNSKSVISLSLKFFTAMIEIENMQLKPDRAIIFNCFERATKIFGKNHPDIWIEFIKYNWELGKFSEAYSLKKRAIESMKGDLRAVEKFELKYVMLRNKLGMNEDIKEEKM
ncbi:unnamed protein product [Chironomus riparius]|uniref:Uncharacterized protein n=1 Tax=Chironomus riparius TaxID=315576 RepID=A0A9N9RIS4_9DIPT|nr:unnamed protein product [Chironomus riparius]